MSNLKKRSLLALIAVLCFGLGRISAVDAASSMETIQAFTGVKIIYNGKELTGTNQPYIINNTAYVPLRMLMENFGDKTIYWDFVGYRVLIADNSSASANVNDQLAQKDTEISTLKTMIRDVSISDLNETLNDYLNHSFTGDFVATKINLTGDEDDLSYSIKLDFSNSSEYDNLADMGQSDSKDFLDDVYLKIKKEIDDTDYDDADITGKLIDNDHPSYYVKYDGNSYTFSWEEKETSVSEILITLDDCFADAGEDYFDDDSIVTTIKLSGDKSDLTYNIKLDFSSSSNFANLAEVDTAKIKSLMGAVKSRIKFETNDTNLEDADISGRLSDNDHSSYYVKYNGSAYDFSW